MDDVEVIPFLSEYMSVLILFRSIYILVLLVIVICILTSFNVGCKILATLRSHYHQFGEP